MKSTGIVRGIDSLGRIVLPKELRTTLHLGRVKGHEACSRSESESDQGV